MACYAGLADPGRQRTADTAVVRTYWDCSTITLRRGRAISTYRLAAHTTGR